MSANVFDSDIFSEVSLTAAVQDVDFVPARIAELGLFDAAGIATTAVWVEKQGDNLGLVPHSPRGSDPGPVDATKRDAFLLESLHLAERGTIYAEEVQNVRPFGQAVGLQSIEMVRDDRLSLLRRRLDATHEWHRVGAIRGLLRQPNGDTIIDLYDRFDIVQTSIAMHLDTSTTDVAVKALDILEAQEDGLGSFPFTMSRAFCGKSFWRKLIQHARVRETYLNHSMAAVLRADRRDSFEFGGIIWERYRGNVGGTAYIPDTEAYVVPEGVPGLFLTRYAPADYSWAVNTMGLPVYVSPEPLRHNKGIELEAQSNPIHFCTRPQAVIRLVEHIAGS